ncbi:MAG: hypothetical protein HC802_11745 [Caldilineaceae bacterium]|nr:hypothetical protein [Caldilineaceae bacterium]
MSRAQIVDEKYRLQEGDLERRPQRVVIANISFQGLEELHAVLHLQGATKRMVLSPAHCQELIRITGSVEWADWVGQTIELIPPRREEPTQITIREIDTEDSHRTWKPRRENGERSGWLTAAFVVALLLGVSALYASQNMEAIQAALQALWP